MKKSWTMRVGVALIALTLVTSCFVGGTFAKYITTNQGAETARVARFGVTVANTADFFSSEYDADEAGFTAFAKTVISRNGDDVVAPGTEGSLVSGNMSGSPEVAVRVSYEVTDLSLVDASLWEVDGAVYFPIGIVVDGTQYKLNGSTIADLDDLKDAVNTALETYTAEYPANTDLSAVTPALDISWKWDFEGTGGYQTDEKDTKLGNQAVADDIEFSITVATTVTQID